MVKFHETGMGLVANNCSRFAALIINQLQKAIKILSLFSCLLLLVNKNKYNRFMV